MIIYQKSKQDFIEDLSSNDIHNIIAAAIKQKTGKNTGQGELSSFETSLQKMGIVLSHKDIPNDCLVAIEYHFPLTSKRADFIITGTDGQREAIVIIELKGWKSATLTTQDGMVNTQFKHGFKNTWHPAYQAWSYASLLKHFNAVIEEEEIHVKPCAYLYNYSKDDTITNVIYKNYLDKAPVFLRSDAAELRAFICQFIKQKESANILARLEKSDMRPGRGLMDCIADVMDGRDDLVLIDDQKEVYEIAMELARNSHVANKNVLIVEGGPGTGKSLVAIKLLAGLISNGLAAKYVTKTQAPRNVYFSKLSGVKPMTELRNLFVGSGAFTTATSNSIPVLIIDEAHRLTEKSGPYRNGTNQVKELIDTALCPIFFIDEDQTVHMDDYATIEVIKDIATAAGANIHCVELASQFRCGGSDGYLAWIDQLLQIRETANISFDGAAYNYDFRVIDTPNELYDIIYEKNKVNNKARLVAGYCWNWDSRRNENIYDITIPEHNFKMKWNFQNYNAAWIIDPNSISEVGCIHTSQGLDVDYIGVIIGKDMIVENGQVKVDPSKRAKDDKSIRGYKKMLAEKPEEAKKKIRAIIKNTYRTLMTRGMRGCYVYCEDKELEKYFKEALAISAAQMYVAQPGK
ncbi:DUF2075 domain-containing protein [Chitinophaga vietnamensis]|uniref:DUF2075 domain-containing protein n=1 Tax=Chitinophaga vietnamensis TaxID=2593957 RepID=UPI0011775623|nr:DUF2075 domain-containing protein [Chitinophaga vietnamensis]